MEGVEVGGCGAIVLLGLGLVAERLVGAAEPVLATRVAQRPVGGLGQRLEVAERQLGVLQVAQRQPSREERRILGGIDGQHPWIAHQVVGHLGLAEPQRCVGVGAPLLPPAVRLDGSGGLRLRQQDLPGLLLFLLAAQGLCLLHGQAPVGLGVRRQLGQEFLRILGAQEDGQTRFRRLLLGLRQQRNDTPDDRGTLVALAGPATVVEQQPVEAALVIGLAQQAAEALQEYGLQGSREIVLRPGLDGDRLGTLLILLGQVGGGHGGQPHARPDLPAGEERLDLGRRRGAVEERLFGSTAQQLPLGPGGVSFEKGANLRCRAKSATVEIPVDELAGRRVGDLVAQRPRVLHLAARRRRDRLAQSAGILGGDGNVADRRDRRIVAGDVLGLIGQRSDQGCRLTGRCRQAGSPSWLSSRPSPQSWALAWRLASSWPPSRSWRRAPWAALAPPMGSRTTSRRPRSGTPGGGRSGCWKQVASRPI